MFSYLQNKLIQIWNKANAHYLLLRIPDKIFNIFSWNFCTAHWFSILCRGKGYFWPLFSASCLQFQIKFSEWHIINYICLHFRIVLVECINCNPNRTKEKEEKKRKLMTANFICDLIIWRNTDELIFLGFKPFLICTLLLVPKEKNNKK